MTHTSGERQNCSAKHFPPFAKQFATAGPDCQTRPPVVGSAAPPGMLESKKSRRRRSHARGHPSALAKALVRRFRPILRAHRQAKSGDGSFLRHFKPCAAIKRPLSRRGYHNPGQRLFRYRDCNTCGGDAITPCTCPALLSSGSAQTFIRRDMFDSILLVGAASSAYERGTAALDLGVVWPNPHFQGPRPASARASAFLKNLQCGHEWSLHRSCSALCCWAALAGCTREYRASTPRPLDDRVLSES